MMPHKPLFEEARTESTPILIPIGGQLTFTAIGLPKGKRVTFSLALVGIPAFSECDAVCNMYAPLPGVAATGPLVKNGKRLELNHENSFVIIDAPQGMHVRAKLESDTPDNGEDLDQEIPLVYYTLTNTSDVTDFMRGYANGPA